MPNHKLRDSALSDLVSDEAAGRLVLGAAALMIVLQLAFRAWALYPSYFFVDDYRLMMDAHDHDLSWDYLVRPFDSQFMPIGRLLVWMVAHAGVTNWSMAASLTLGLQGASSSACMWMLVKMFGARPGILALLAIYLTSAVALPSFMWWAAAINQLPMQLTFFVAVGSWVLYLRGSGRRWLLATAVALAFGALAYVKTILVVGVLLFILAAYFVEGGPRHRVVHLLRRYGLGAALIVLPTAAFALFYATAVPQPFEPGASRVAVWQDVARSMLGESLPTGVWGGPWTWLNSNPPIVLAQPPPWSVTLSWVGVALVVVYSLGRRHRSGRAWVLLAGYSLVALALLVTTRGQLFGGVSGLEYRYLTDVLPVLILSLGLAFLELPGAVGSSAERQAPLITVKGLPIWMMSMLALVSLGGVLSSWQYVQYWHEENAGRTYVKNLQSGLRAHGPVDLPDQLVPAPVMPNYTQPKNSTRLFVPLVAAGARFPSVTRNLSVIDSDGNLWRADVEAAVTSQPGPEAGCGWRADEGSTTIPLTGRAFDFTWWVRIGYLGSGTEEVDISAGNTRLTAPVQQGLQSLYFKVEGAFDSITLSGLDSPNVMCIDTIEVGQPEMGERL